MQILGVGIIFVYRAQHFRLLILEKVTEIAPEILWFILFNFILFHLFLLHLQHQMAENIHKVNGLKY